MRENEDNAGVSRIATASESDARYRDDYVFAARDSTPFHMFGWREVCLSFQGSIVGPLGFPRKKYFDLFPNYLLYAKAFKYAISLGSGN